MTKRPKKQTSSRVSTIAGRVMRNMRSARANGFKSGDWVGVRMRDAVALAASALSQDEVKGQRAPKKRRKAKSRKR